MDNLDKLELIAGQLKELPISIQIKKALEAKRGLTPEELNYLEKANNIISYASTLVGADKLDIVVERHKAELLGKKQAMEDSLVAITAELTKVDAVSDTKVEVGK